MTNKTNDGNAIHEPTIIDHHVHYLEIDGYDETVEMTRSEHSKLHIRLRKTGKCNIPVDELAKISNAAHKRGAKYKAHQKAYYAEHKDEIDARAKVYREEHADEIAAHLKVLSDEAKAYNKAEISECEFCWEHFGDEMLDEIAKHEDEINAKARDRRAAKKLEAQA